MKSALHSEASNSVLRSSHHDRQHLTLPTRYLADVSELPLTLNGSLSFSLTSRHASGQKFGSKLHYHNYTTTSNYPTNTPLKYVSTPAYPSSSRLSICPTYWSGLATTTHPLSLLTPYPLYASAKPS